MLKFLLAYSLIKKGRLIYMINKDMTIKYLWTTNIEAIHINGITAPVDESVPTTKGISIPKLMDAYSTPSSFFSW